MTQLDHQAELAALSAATELMELADRESSAARVLGALCDLSRDALAAEAATVMVTDEARLRFVHAAPAAFAVMGQLQDRLQAGPCLDSVDQLPALSTTTDEWSRWPPMVAAASALGIANVLSVPMVSRGRPWGVLDLYRSSGPPWSPGQVLAATLLARIAANFMAGAADQRASWSARIDLEHRATHDPLTNLANRALLFDRLEHATLTAARHHASLALLFIDLDQFKSINDSFGHAAGDEVLVEVSRRLSGIVRDSDTLARLSGDEFIVICEDLPPKQATVITYLEELGRRIQGQLHQPLSLHPAVQLTASIGIAVGLAGTHTGSGRHLLVAADGAMYQAKRSGLGQTVIRCPI